MYLLLSKLQKKHEIINFNHKTLKTFIQYQSKQNALGCFTNLLDFAGLVKNFTNNFVVSLHTKCGEKIRKFLVFLMITIPSMTWRLNKF